MKFTTKFSVASRNTLLRFPALFVATFGGVTAMVDSLREMFDPATLRGSEIATTNFGEYPFYEHFVDGTSANRPSAKFALM